MDAQITSYLLVLALETCVETLTSVKERIALLQDRPDVLDGFADYIVGLLSFSCARLLTFNIQNFLCSDWLLLNSSLMLNSILRHQVSRCHVLLQIFS